MLESAKNRILKFYRTHKRMPSYREIAKLLEFQSSNAAYKLVNKLIEAGFLTKDCQGKLLPNKIFGEVPLLGLVTAGFPALAEETMLDSVSLDDLMVEKKEKTYLLEVDGDSMIDAHIASGDLVIVEKTDRACDNDIVVAEVDGEWTMKYFKIKNNQAWLEPANKNFRPIYPTQSLTIGGVVKGVIRKY